MRRRAPGAGQSPLSRRRGVWRGCRVGGGSRRCECRVWCDSRRAGSRIRRPHRERSPAPAAARLDLRAHCPGTAGEVVAIGCQFAGGKLGDELVRQGRIALRHQQPRHPSGDQRADDDFVRGDDAGERERASRAPTQVRRGREYDEDDGCGNDELCALRAEG